METSLTAEQRYATEQRLLWQSAGLMGLIAVAATWFGLLTNSHAILIDGIFSFVAVIIKILMIMTSRLTTRESSKKFQFGYWQFEPLVLAAEGGFTLIIVVYAFLNGMISLFSGGNAMNFGLAIIYALTFTFANMGYYLYVHRVNRKLKSSLIHFDNMSWLVDACFAASLFISFGLAYLLERTQYAHYGVFVDPVILIILSLTMMPVALNILGPAVSQVLGMAPEGLHEKVHEVMDDFMVRYRFKDYVSSVQRYGKIAFIDIDILIPKSYPIQEVGDLDRIRDEIDKALGGKSVRKWLTITFTTSRRWMAQDYELLEEEDE
ncbi:MAG: cation transporter [Negativicoccus succinicivorans]|uniref:Cation efflux family protein n=2 Tax=Negativicoccus succinicivorans TaxID=620903 RepID=W1TYG1_9FIRM|nr:cation transporter [Negativicoccus succinicivorans]ETI86476.1 MAG: Cation efflux family protein [Negativicoccus succinicivorans DORA_17_25]MBB6478245.1 putative Co/Zn/Cd cation transporter (cation efflux family) [Negativicoccus succinicivorans]MBS5917940.1 cation transporter [Negativicoccus succinicivorans]MDU1056761.1 cation transporter [Negativicoccus succinicivorans]MDU5657534.1 cation transporter [Negativicoccus succinicivorans]